MTAEAGNVSNVSKEFCLRLPKVELHAHINGSISDATMTQLTERKGLSYDPQARLQFKRGEIGTLEEVFKMFHMIHTVTDNVDAVYKITYDVIHDFAAHNVKYLELRTTPRAEQSTGMTKTEYIETVLKAISDCSSEDIDIIVRLILAIDRRGSTQVAMDTVQMAVKYREISNGVIVGVDLSGDPNKGDAADFIPAFLEAQKHGLKLALHLAEVPAPEETLHVLQRVTPDRIGHGTCLQYDTGGTQQIQQLVAEKQVPIELCLSSNITTMTVDKFDNHHFKYWYDIGHPCIVCTDDKGVFSTTLPDEYRIAAETFQLTREQLWKLSYDSINFIFADDKTKSILRKKWDEMKSSVFAKS